MVRGRALSPSALPNYQQHVGAPEWPRHSDGVRDGLRHALARLDPRSREVIEARWLREDDKATLQDLADRYGVSAERIRQIESKALKIMRGQMGAVQ